MTAAGLPAHVDADLRARPVLRAVHHALVTDPEAVALVVPHGRGVLPEGVVAVDAGRAHVGRVSRERAVEIASARSSRAAEQLGADPPAGGRWILYLDAGARCAVVPFLMPGAARQANDAPEPADVREALPPDAVAFFDALAAATPEGYEPPSTWPASQRAADVEKFTRADLACLYLDGEAAAHWTEAVTAAGADLSTATLVRYDDGVAVVFYRAAGKGRAA